MPLQKQYLHSTTQDYLEIYDVTNDLVILKDGSVAMVLQTSAINFGLLSEEEQDATIYTYAGMLNSLSFPIQILIRSQRKDVTNYLNYLKSQEQQTIHPLRKTQIRRYREFIETLVQETNVLDKKFYIVIPLSAIELGLPGAASPLPTISIPTAKKAEEQPLDKVYILEKAKTNLEPKRDHLISQLARIGLSGRQLTTQELIQLLYSIYNPEAASEQVMTNSRDYTTPIVEASVKGMVEQPALQQIVSEQRPAGVQPSPSAPTPIPAPAAPTPEPEKPAVSSVTPEPGVTLTQPQTQTPPAASVPTTQTTPPKTSSIPPQVWPPSGSTLVEMTPAKGSTIFPTRKPLPTQAPLPVVPTTPIAPPAAPAPKQSVSTTPIEVFSQ